MGSQNKAEKFWDRMAKNYDKEEKQDEPVLLKVVEKTKKHLTITDSILDFGCGTGLVSNKLANNVKYIKGIDISSRMIALAKEKAINSKINNIDYEHATIYDKQLEIDSFETLLAFYILHLVEDPEDVVERLYELIKPDGLFISATPCMGDRKFLKGLFSIGSKLGLIPKVYSFKYADLHNIIEKRFEVIEAECLHLKTNQYFIVARKK